VPEGSVLQQGREKGRDVAVITDDFMREMRARARSYSLVILRRAARYNEPEAGAVIWEHRRRNHSLRAYGVLAIVCPVAYGTEWSRIGIFDKTPEETARSAASAATASRRAKAVGNDRLPAFLAAAEIGVSDPNACPRPADGRAASMDQLGRSGGDGRPRLLLHGDDAARLCHAGL
jgi:hypothetical protein